MEKKEILVVDGVEFAIVENKYGVSMHAEVNSEQTVASELGQKALEAFVRERSELDTWSLEMETEDGETYNLEYDLESNEVREFWNNERIGDWNGGALYEAWENARKA